jgi:hypothetical protein
VRLCGALPLAAVEARRASRWRPLIRLDLKKAWTLLDKLTSSHGQLAADDHLAVSINTMDLKNRLLRREASLHLARRVADRVDRDGSLAPEILEARRRQLGVSDRVLN